MILFYIKLKGINYGKKLDNPLTDDFITANEFLGNQVKNGITSFLEIKIKKLVLLMKFFQK